MCEVYFEASFVWKLKFFYKNLNIQTKVCRKQIVIKSCWNVFITAGRKFVTTHVQMTPACKNKNRLPAFTPGGALAFNPVQNLSSCPPPLLLPSSKPHTHWVLLAYFGREREDPAGHRGSTPSSPGHSRSQAWIRAVCARARPHSKWVGKCIMLASLKR